MLQLGIGIVDKIFLFDDVHDRVALLAFHMALITHPQHAFVILTFASVLYHANWKEAVKFAEKHVENAAVYGPEFSDTEGSISDDELAKNVAQLAVQVQKSINILTDRDSLLEAMSKFPGAQCSGLVGKHTFDFYMQLLFTPRQFVCLFISLCLGTLYSYSFTHMVLQSNDRLLWKIQI